MSIKKYDKSFNAEVMNNKGIWHTVRLVAEETFDNGQKAFIDICGYYYNFHMPIIDEKTSEEKNNALALRISILTLLSALGYPNGDEDVDEIVSKCWDGISDEEITNLIVGS